MGLKEYFIQGAAYQRSRGLMDREFAWYRFDETSDGTDEYDALERLLGRYSKNNSASKDDLYVEVRIRPTGRKGGAPFFAEQREEHPYNKGLLSRFWIRFTLSETEEELKHYGEQFNQFIQNSSFREESLERMRQQYANQLQHIRAKNIKPEPYQLIAPTGSPEKIAESCSKQAARFLRSFGFRVAEYKNEYEVKALDCHSLYFGHEQTLMLSAVDLVFYWQGIAETREFDVEDIFYDMGYVVDNKENEYVKLLRANHLAAYIIYDDAGMPSICVLKKELKHARDLLSKHQVKLVDDYTDIDDFDRRSAGLGDNYYHNLDNMFEK
ncbi:hypothetical protein [Paenibacillus sp. GXUN7292]|uniref:hypothetical protein n=1 Tax=Paenibacillus sp. GXUN7292 TaxID=3422499 RepID=UPI003D7E0B31